jgi:uncharacterized protein (DUF885 family)
MRFSVIVAAPALVAVHAVKLGEKVREFDQMVKPTQPVEKEEIVDVAAEEVTPIQQQMKVMQDFFANMPQMNFSPEEMGQAMKNFKDVKFNFDDILQEVESRAAEKPEQMQQELDAVTHMPEVEELMTLLPKEVRENMQTPEGLIQQVALWKNDPRFEELTEIMKNPETLAQMLTMSMDTMAQNPEEMQKMFEKMPPGVEKMFENMLVNLPQLPAVVEGQSLDLEKDALPEETKSVEAAQIESAEEVTSVAPVEEQQQESFPFVDEVARFFTDEERQMVGSDTTVLKKLNTFLSNRDDIRDQLNNSYSYNELEEAKDSIMAYVQSLQRMPNQPHIGSGFAHSSVTQGVKVGSN